MQTKSCYKNLGDVSKRKRPLTLRQKVALRKARLHAHTIAAENKRLRTRIKNYNHSDNMQEIFDSSATTVEMFISRDDNSYNIEIMKKEPIVIGQDESGTIQILRDLGVTQIDGFDVERVISLMRPFGKEYKVIIPSHKAYKVLKYVSTRG